jgi:NADPH:quinone reductase-like Zn-dependent oxidoreductase
MEVADLMNDAMSRWEIPSLGLDKLTLRSAPRPVPKAGEILVEVEAISLNYRRGGCRQQHGHQSFLPIHAASDMAGRVVAVGEGATRFSVGDRVILLSPSADHPLRVVAPDDRHRTGDEAPSIQG